MRSYGWKIRCHCCGWESCVDGAKECENCELGRAVKVNCCVQSVSVWPGALHTRHMCELAGSHNVPTHPYTSSISPHFSHNAISRSLAPAPFVASITSAQVQKLQAFLVHFPHAQLAKANLSRADIVLPFHCIFPGGSLTGSMQSSVPKQGCREFKLRPDYCAYICTTHKSHEMIKRRRGMVCQ